MRFMHFRTSSKPYTRVSTNVLLLGSFQEELHADPINLACRGALARQATVEGFSGKVGQTLLYFSDGALAARQVLVFGLGPRAGFNVTVLRKALTAAFRRVKLLKAPTLTIAPLALEGFNISQMQYGESVGLYAGLIDYVINHAKTKCGGHQPEKHLLEVTVLCSANEESSVRQGLETGRIIACAVNRARDLANMPASDLTPMKLAEAAVELADKSGGSIKAKLICREELKHIGANALLAVSKGSTQEPVLIELTYTPTNVLTKEVLGFVGKSVTFDSGGLDLKTAEGMRNMKRDMAGGAAVLAAVGAVASLKLPISVKAVLAATENMPDGSSYKPGDVIHTMSGLTVEVDNTDAEGRLTLADAIEYIKRYCGVTRIVDLATLTGAIRSYGGDVAAGAFGNQSPFTHEFLLAADAAGELIGELPMWEELRSANHSDMADLKNSGGDPGSVTAAWFIREFAGEEIPWVHVDIAGTSYRTRELGADPKGATGFGVRTLIELSRKYCR